MKISSLKLFVAAAIMLLSVGMGAQQQPPHGNGRPAPPKMKTPEEIAKKEADMMKAEVALTDKQYKKVYKLIKKDHEYRQEQARSQFGGMGGFPGGGPGGMPPQGGMGGSGGMGGGSMGGGMPPQGGMGGFPGGGDMMGGGMGGPGGMGGGAMGGGMPPQGGMGGFPGGDVITDEYLEKQDKKLQKILTLEQYTKWRSKHPAEHLELPPIDRQ